MNEEHATEGAVQAKVASTDSELRPAAAPDTPVANHDGGLSDGREVEDGPPLPTFDAKRHRKRSNPFTRAAVWLSNRHALWWFLRRFWPLPRLPGLQLVTRYADVADVLNHHTAFRVPFDKEITRLNGDPGGTPFLLGIDDEEQHARQLQLVMEAFRLDDALEFSRIARASAERRLQKGLTKEGRIDAIPLLSGVAVDICNEYYGMKIFDPEMFAYAAMAVSGHLFGKPPIINNDKAEAANEGAAYVRAVIDRSIQRASRARSSASPDSDTVLSRLVSPKGRQPHPPDSAGQTNGACRADQSATSGHDEIRALILGMIVGFVPTSTMASGHILETLLKRKTFMRCARDAARTGDDDLLKRCLYETSRFWPINPGPFRICEQDYELGGDARHARTIKKGATLLVSTMSAMFDSRQVDQPFKFKGDRPASNYLLFGHGLHWCVGAFIAQAHFTQTFKVLLRHGEFQRAAGAAGKLALYNGFPDHLTVQFEMKR